MTQEATKHDRRLESFVGRLDTLGPGDRARLRRDAGNPLAEAGTLGLFYRICPPGYGAEKEELLFLVATLFPLLDGAATGNFGNTLSVVRHRLAPETDGLDRRFETLLDADSAQLGFRLRQLIKLARAHGCRVNWLELAEDLLRWDSPRRSTQRKWARAYFFKQPAADPSGKGNS